MESVSAGAHPGRELMRMLVVSEREDMAPLPLGVLVADTGADLVQEALPVGVQPLVELIPPGRGRPAAGPG